MKNCVDKDFVIHIDCVKSIDKKTFGSIRKHLDKLKEQLIFNSKEDDDRRHKEDAATHRYGPVHHAAATGNTVLLEYLLIDRPESVNIQTEHDNSTPLHLAARYLQNECVDLLLRQSGIKPDLPDGRGREALHVTGLNASHHVDDPEEPPVTSLHSRRSGSALKTVEKLLAGRTESPVDDDRNTAFVLMAASRGDVQLFEYLLRNNWKIVQLKDDKGSTALHKCVQFKDLGLLKTILHYLKNMDVLQNLSPDEIGPLCDAAFQGWADGVREMLTAGARVSEEEEGDFNVLHWAAIGRSHEVINMLLERATRVGNIFQIIDAPCLTGETPIFCAVASWKLESVHLFLKWGADVNRKGHGNYNLIHRAMTRMTLDAGEGDEVTSNGKDMLLYLLEYPGLKSLVNEVTTIDISEGWFGTPLNIAAWFGNLECMEILVEDYKGDIAGHFDADGIIQGVNSGHWTPLHSAAYRGNADIINYIVGKNWSTIAARTEDGWTPLHVAAWKNQDKSVKTLLNLGASLAEIADVVGKKYSALEMIIDKHKSPKELLMQIFDACIINSSESDSRSKSFVEINYNPIRPQGDETNFQVLLTLAKCDKEYSTKLNKDELILHPVMETSVYLKMQEMIYTILAICSIHYFFVMGFYLLTVFWHKNEYTPTTDIIGLILMVVWLRFTLEKGFASEFFNWRTLPLCLCLLLAMAMTGSRFTALGWISDYSPLVLVPMVVLVSLRVLYYFNPAALTTVFILMMILLQALAVASVTFVIFMVFFMMKLSIDDPFNEFGWWVINQLVSLIIEIKNFFGVDEIELAKRLYIALPVLATYILKINPYTGYFKKFLWSKERQGRVESIVEQATILERMNKFWFQKFQVNATSKSKCPDEEMERVYHDKNYDSKNHGSILLGNRVWERVADWYIQQEAPDRQKDADLFSQEQ